MNAGRPIFPGILEIALAASVVAIAVMIAHIYLAKGAIVPKHEHVNEQITYVIEGRMRFSLGEDGTQLVEVGAGEVLQIPAHLPHSAEALEDTLDVDVFHPPRQDWLDGDDSYLR